VKGYRPKQPFKQEKYNTNQKYKCKNNIRFIYLTLTHCKCKFENINNFSLGKTMNKLFLIKSINNISLLKAQKSR
jgi:hypothetical protein